MFRKEILAASLLALLIGCTARGTAVTSPDGGVVGSDPDGGVDPDGLPPVVESSKARLRFKGGPVYATLLSTGLGIAKDVLCKELGLYDCVSMVHRISLLDVEPYQTGIIEPLDNTVVSSPIAVERVALSACTRRAREDLAAPASARIFGADRAASTTKLYQQLLQRDPEPREIEHLEALYHSMEEVGDPKLDESWAAMSCFAVATTTEALFY